MRAVAGLLDMGSHDEAKTMADKLVQRYDDQVKKLCA
jgi:hypothetical protein